MKLLKKLFKSGLVVCLLIVGLIMNSLIIRANDASTYGPVVPYIRTYTHNLDYSNVHINLKFRPTGGYTDVTFDSATCEAFASNTSCSVVVISRGTYTDSDYSQRLVIKLRMTSGTNVETWQFKYFYDRLESKTKL